MEQTAIQDTKLTKWRLLFRITAISYILMAVIIPIQIIIFSISFPPQTIEGWFKLFQDNWLLGLVHMDFLYILDNVLIVIMYLTFYFTLKQKNESLMTIALILGLLGIAAYFSSNKAFEMLSVSKLYYNSVTDTDRTVYLAVGQMLVSSWKGTAFDIYYVLNAVTLLITSTVMLKSNLFNKKTAITGLVSGIFMVIPSTAGTIGLVFSLLSLIPWIAFLILVAHSLLCLRRHQLLYLRIINNG
ncbi:MAG: DUF4386 family protein [Anaerocolumna sp.]